MDRVDLLRTIWLRKNLGLREELMRRTIFGSIMAASFATVILLGAGLRVHARQAQAQQVQTAYPKMAALDEYLMADRDGEIALARSAAPESISRDSEVMVLGRHGYETAAKGKNGFVCLVERGWTAGNNDPNFWNPKLRGPLCLNPPAVRTYLPITIKKTELVFAGQSEAQMFESLKVAFDKKELPALEPGAMSYMLSKDSNLGDGNGHWRPHIMLFVPQIDAGIWGANAAGSPILATADAEDRMTIILIPVAKWSDGTTDVH